SDGATGVPDPTAVLLEPAQTTYWLPSGPVKVAGVSRALAVLPDALVSLYGPNRASGPGCAGLKYERFAFGSYRDGSWSGATTGGRTVRLAGYGAGLVGFWVGLFRWFPASSR